MTLSRQIRHKERARREAEPYRAARLRELAVEALEAGTRVIVNTRGLLPSADGYITATSAERLWVAREPGGLADRSPGTNVPWKHVTDIRPWET